MKRLATAAMGFALVAGSVAPHGSWAQRQPVASIALLQPGSTVQLYPGCNNIALTFLDGTASATVVQAVTPAGVVESMWRHNPAEGRWDGYSPAFPEVGSLPTVDFLDAVWLCIAEMAAAPTATPPPAMTFSVHFIDVAQGDAILVEIDDVDILVDGGFSGPRVLPYLAGQEVPDIDLVVLTHPHADHYGGLADVLAQYNVLEIWTNGATEPTPAYQEFATAVAAEGAIERQIRRGYSTQFRGLTLTALHPVNPVPDNTNSESIVLHLSCGSVAVLLTGDATADSEVDMLADSSLDLEADVLKVGHHGSPDSTTDAFLDAVTPNDAVISVGADNTRGHPGQEVLNRLAAHGATVYRTDLDGTIVLTSDCSDYSMSPVGGSSAAP